MMTWWPVFVWSAMQEDDVEIFELGDVVTWPVLLIDAAAEPGWPQHVGVQTTAQLNVDEEERRWAATADFEVATRLAGSSGSMFDIRAGLKADFFEAAFFQSCVTGTVRRIELASTFVPRPEVEPGEDSEPKGAWGPPDTLKLPVPSSTPGPIADPCEDLRPDPVWDLSETPVAPLKFAHGRSDAGRIDHGMLVHLEVFKPQCRCREIGSLSWGTGIGYAMRHLRQISVQTPGSTRYRCPDTGLIFTENSWTPRADPAVPDFQPSPQMELRREDRPR